jgi:mono/diheme cytochrome c family protein
MKSKTVMTAIASLMIAGSAMAEDSALVLGMSGYDRNCAVCHGADAKGGGSVGELFAVKPSDLTVLAKENDGNFPFAEVYHIIISGMQKSGHGSSEMPVWGDYFMADAMEDRGVNAAGAMEMAAGRALALTYYLESLQQ